MYEFYLIFFISRCGFNLSYDNIQSNQDSMKNFFFFFFCDIHIWDFKTSYVK